MPELNGQEIGPTGYGLMGLTWRIKPPSDEQAFEAMRAALANGCNFWNGGEFYGPPERNSPVLLERYFAKYPEDASKVVLSIKGSCGPDAHTPSGKPEEVRRSMNVCLDALKGRKKIDIFEAARRDPNTPLEVTFGVLQKEYIDKGLLGGIALSEVNVDTIHEAVKHAKIVAVEVELNLWETSVLTNGVADACVKYNIPLVAYSPIGRGALSGKIKTYEDTPPELKAYPRFSRENFDTNLQLIKEVEELAQKKNCTPAQLAIGWTRALSKRPGMPVIIPIPGATTVDRVQENSRHVDLTLEELDHIDTILAKFEIKGNRYPDGVPVNT